MTPKSWLRHAKAVSTLESLSAGKFERILADPAKPPPAGVKRILLCSGKIYYDLEKEREEKARRDIAMLRLEQLYPLRKEELETMLAAYPAGTPVRWVQEEPENMGPWRYLFAQFGEQLFGKYPFAGIQRESSASPATGSASRHKGEQAELIKRAFAL